MEMCVYGIQIQENKWDKILKGIQNGSQVYHGSLFIRTRVANF